MLPSLQSPAGPWKAPLWPWRRWSLCDVERRTPTVARVAAPGRACEGRVASRWGASAAARNVTVRATVAEGPPVLPLFAVVSTASMPRVPRLWGPTCHTRPTEVPRSWGETAWTQGETNLEPYLATLSSLKHRRLDERCVQNCIGYERDCNHSLLGTVHGIKFAVACSTIDIELSGRILNCFFRIYSLNLKCS